MLFGRMSGILLHPTSLPGPYGIGDLGPRCYEFIDFLVKSGQQLWQVLPLGPTGYGNSPYMCYSAFAGNPLLVSPDLLVQQGWLAPGCWEALPQWAEITRTFVGQVNYDAVVPFKMALLDQAWNTFQAKASEGQQQDFNTFCESERYWLRDYALFMALKEIHQDREWVTWDTALANRDPDALQQAEADHAAAIQKQQFYQYLFFQQWQRVKDYAKRFGIKLMGDLPIYVAYNSADAWANRSIFLLEPDGKPLLVAGVPPDAFSDDGQLWGNPLYDWQALKNQGYSWWISRMKATLSLVDCVRIDHFRGFESYWAVPYGAGTAKDGSWKPGPGMDFFDALKESLGEIPVVAEDLGDITPEVLDLRNQCGYPGMKILQFAFGGDPNNPYIPHQYHQNCVVYTGTHDNNTTVGWFYSDQMPEWSRDLVKRYIGAMGSEGIHWDMIRLAFGSIAELAIIPLQDVMGLGEDSRMNFPGTASNNWGWRFTSEMLHEGVIHTLANHAVAFGRISPEELVSRRAQLT